MYECLRQLTMKLDGLTANAQSHEEAIKEAAKAIAAIQKPIKTCRETLKEYGKAEAALRKTLLARKQCSGKLWKEPVLWPPEKWQATRAESGNYPETESERILDVCGRRFRQSCPAIGTWTMAARELAMEQFREQVLKMNLATHTPEFAKSRIYLGYVLEESGRFGDAAESFQDALDALDEQSENLQERLFWKVQQQEVELRFEAMDTLGAEQEAEEALLKKLDQQIESCSTERCDTMQSALQVLRTPIPSPLVSPYTSIKPLARTNNQVLAAFHPCGGARCRC